MGIPSSPPRLSLSPRKAVVTQQLLPRWGTERQPHPRAHRPARGGLPLAGVALAGGARVDASGAPPPT
ncbi:hypothetical protein NL676_029058 [Syzygium grande]|nr:hypothetical protein NL676_029058 [Syzygium grande]